ncbi:MAG: TlpA family protein disulfide reductase [Thiovulaceae bacterium]|nr:TlpA family protein disulfide reductase [Sulfurimonadaceae bacterium]
MRFYALILSMSLLFTACEDSQENTTQIPVASYELETADATIYKMLKQGNNLKIQGHEGKVILIDIFATWCPACKVITPHLSNLGKKYSKELLVLGILIEKNKPHSYVEAYKKKYEATYPISNCEENFDLASRIAADLRQPRSFPIPLMIMYDTKGNYFRHYTGAVPEEIIDRDIQSALGKK